MRTPGALLVILVGMAAADTPAVDPVKVRQCSAWCVDSYKGAIAESLGCIDSCQRGYPNHPVALCAKGCVGKHAGDVPGIVDCIGRCGAPAARKDG